MNFLNYNITDIPYGLTTMSAKEIREQLEPIHDSMESISGRISHNIESISRQNREKNKQDRRQLLEEQIILVLNKYEFGLIVNALNELRTDLQKENKDREPVNELLLRLLNTPVKKKSIFKRERIVSER